MLLTLQQMQERLAQMSYRGWQLRLYEGVFEGTILQIQAQMEDNFNPGRPFLFDCRTPVGPFSNLAQFDLAIMKRLNRIAIHESMEALQIDGKPLFDPHRPDADRDELPVFQEETAIKL